MSQELPELGPDVRDFAETPDVKIKRLEGALADQRRFARRMGRQLHSRMRRELRTADDRARRAEKQAAGARREAAAQRRRAEAAEAELQALRASRTWRTGNAVLAVPRRLRSLRS